MNKDQDHSTLHLIAAVQELRKLHTLVTDTILTTENKIKDIESLGSVDASTIGKVPFGTVFRRDRREDPDMYIRCRPTSFLLNSVLVSESLSSGKSLICNLNTGSTFFVQGSEPISVIDRN